MSKDLEAGGGSDVGESIREDTKAVSDESKDLVVEAKSSLVILICTILVISLLSILLSTWMAKTITNSPASFGTILGRYFGFDRNETEQILTWWKPVHLPKPSLETRQSAMNKSLTTTSTAKTTTKARRIPYSDYPRFHTIILPLLFISSIILAALSYYARYKCTDRNFAWGAVPKVPMGRVDPATVAAAVVKSKEAEPGVDYTIVQGTTEAPVVFALAETLQPLNEPREPGAIVDEGTQYSPNDVQKPISRVSSAPTIQKNGQHVPSVSSPSDDQQRTIESLQRPPLPTITPSK